MPDYSDRFGGKFMKAEHVTKPFVGVVAAVTDELVNEHESKKRPVIYFEGHERGVVLNSTRYDAMSHLGNSKDTDDWLGMRVGVRRGKTRFAGKQVDCIEFTAPPREDVERDLNDKAPF